MKKEARGILVILVAMMLVQVVMAVDTGGNISISITTEGFEPMIWMCDNRVVYDDNLQWGRVSLGGEEMIERLNNYAFEGEMIQWVVLVMDKNKIEQITEIGATVGSVQGSGNPLEVECVELNDALQGDPILPECNARIDEEEIEYFDDQIMAYYECSLTIETPATMHGPYWITIEVNDSTGLNATVDENEYWFLNPTMVLTIDGGMTTTLSFSNVRPGTVSYSDTTLLVGNGAEPGSGVLLDMFITGTDFYDPTPSGAVCEGTNSLKLKNFRYYATNGAYSTQNDLEFDNKDSDRDRDEEGYMNIEYGNSFSVGLYDNAEIIQSSVKSGPYYLSNILSPGSKIALTFKLSLPEPCVGSFTGGSIYFWGEAI